ncbi:gag protein [Brown greater galago prosimian foamy virus]|uniref:Gag polyprotein n=1 Tax=Brown greater galago prosimian foamy virus TaxID=2170139 RepID=A0A088F783_9RETR|nr:gag protein [Brown greater galago prosimian foamy virus]AIM40342.1 gag protein [Brown greater galago prosimian foamy virus]
MSQPSASGSAGAGGAPQQPPPPPPQPGPAAPVPRAQIGYGDLDVLLLQQEYHLIDPNLQVQHLDTLLVRITGGNWGPGDRFARIEVLLRDTLGPLQQPRYRYAAMQQADLRNDIILHLNYQDAIIIFDMIIPSEGVHRHGPMFDGLWIHGDDYSMNFQPITAHELYLLPQQVLTEEVELLTEVCNRMADWIRRHRCGGGSGSSQPPPPPPPAVPVLPSAPPASSLPLPPQGWGISPPVATSTPGAAGHSSSAGPNISLGGTYVPPPVAPPAPVIGGPGGPGQLPAMVQVLPAQPVVIPINVIRSVCGDTPSNPQDIPLWMGRIIPAIEGVFPIDNPNLRMRVVNALLALHPGLAITELNAQTWGQVLAVLHMRALGHTALHQLPALLETIVKTDGILPAYNMGMEVTQQDFSYVWGILRTLLPGQAFVLSMQNELDRLPAAQRPGMFPGLLQRTLDILGLNSRGQNIQKTNTQQQAPKRGQKPKPRLPPVHRRPAPFTPPATPSPRQQASASPSSQGDNRSPQPQGRGTYGPSRGGGSGPRYNFRPRVQPPDRYGFGRGQGGRSSIGAQDNQQPGQGGQRTQQTNQNRNQGNATGGRTQPQNRTVNTVRVTQTNPQGGSSVSNPAVTTSQNTGTGSATQSSSS